jgi:predicted dehydrogenase
MSSFARARSAWAAGISAAPLARRLGSRPLRVGFFGAGDISNLHFDAVSSSPAVELAGVWNRSDCPIVPDPQAKADAYGCALYPSAEALAADPTIDAIFVLTNMESHSALAELAMAHGKHVYVEKPVCATLPELDRLTAAAADNGVVCMPGHNYIYEPGVARMRELLASGALGDPCSLEIHYNIAHPEAVCARLPGVIRQILTHHAYCSLYLLGGPPSELTAMTATINDGSVPQENLAVVLMKQQGALSTLQASFAADDHTSDPWSFHIKLLGTKGGARYSYNDWVVNAPHIVHSHTYAAYPETIRAASTYFVEEVLGKGAQPLSTLQDAVVCQRIIEAAEASAAEGRHVQL